MICKIFKNISTEELQLDVNNFLKANKQSCNFIKMTQSQAAGSTTITIFYVRKRDNEVEIRHKSAESFSIPSNGPK